MVSLGNFPLGGGGGGGWEIFVLQGGDPLEGLQNLGGARRFG